MRIGKYQRENIKHTILNDLYEKIENTFGKLKEDFLIENYQLYIKPYITLLTHTMPSEFLWKGREIQTKIVGHLNINSERVEYNTFWDTYLDSPQILPPPANIYGPATIPLMPEMCIKLQLLYKEIITLEEEKSTLVHYLNKTLRENQGSVKLRKVWPECLHKYLPDASNTRRIKKKNSKIVEDTPTLNNITDVLSRRMTTNLLEGE